MRIEERIGTRVREARQRRGWSQEVLGEQVGHRLGRPWSAQTVSVAENGGRDFDAEDMLVLSLVLGHTVAWFYEPGMGVMDPSKGIAEITLPSGYTVVEKSMRNVYGIPNKEAPGLAQELEQLARRVALLGQGEQS